MPFDKNQIRKFAIMQLKASGCEAWRQTFIPVRGRTFQGQLGAADVSGINPQGARIELEVKAIGDKIRDDQRDFMRMIKKMGGIALLATEENGKLVIKEFPTDIK